MYHSPTSELIKVCTAFLIVSGSKVAIQQKQFLSPTVALKFLDTRNWRCAPFKYAEESQLPLRHLCHWGLLTTYSTTGF